MWSRVSVPFLTLPNKQLKSHCSITHCHTARQRTLKTAHKNSSTFQKSLRKACPLIHLCSVLAITLWSFATPKKSLTNMETTKIAEILCKKLFWTAFPCFSNPLITSWDEILQQRVDNLHQSYAVGLWKLEIVFLCLSKLSKWKHEVHPNSPALNALFLRATH